MNVGTGNLEDSVAGSSVAGSDVADEHKTPYAEPTTTSAQTITRRRSLRRSIFTKLKIVIAVWQIASSTDTVFWNIRFPPVFQKVTHLFNFLGFSFFDVGSFKCLFGYSYYEKLVFVTLAPVLAVPLIAGIYGVIEGLCGKLITYDDRRKFIAKVTYVSLLFLYVVLPSISNYVITYFSCRDQCRNQFFFLLQNVLLRAAAQD